jgi:hypothetical protein
MTRADRVLSTPPLNTPIDTNRRRFLAVAAGASVASVGTLAVAAMPTAAPAAAAACAVDPAFALIAEKRAADLAHEAACVAYSEAEEEYGTCAPDVAAITWKRAALARGQYRYAGVKSERIERAIAEDLAFLAAHPIRRRKGNAP